MKKKIFITLSLILSLTSCAKQENPASEIS